jgi:hypothetical protein
MKSGNAAITSIVIIWIGFLGLRVVLWQCSVVRLNTNVLSTFEFAGESDWRECNPRRRLGTVYPRIRSKVVIPKYAANKSSHVQDGNENARPW